MIEETINFIRKHAHDAKRPAFMCSFGKDSMALAELIRRALPTGLNGTHMPMAHGFPMEVIYHRDPWFPHKHEFADYTARSWGMIVHDYPPLAAGIKIRPDMLELVSRYNFGTQAMDIPKNVTPPIDRRDYICGLNDWLLRPKNALFPYPWDVVFLGHKSSDVDPFEGAVPLKWETAMLGGVKLVFPLRDWTDNDVWTFIEDNHVPIPKARYENRQDRVDTWHNNDYVHACTACIDPRDKREAVFCPKLNRDVPNVGNRVLQLHAEPEYVGKGDD